VSKFNEPKSPLTSARMFDKLSDAELADWLDNDAQAMDGQPGQNNHVAATRAAAERLRRDEQADREPSDAEVEAAARKVFETDAPSHEPEEWFTVSPQLRNDYRATARVALLAAKAMRDVS